MRNRKKWWTKRVRECRRGGRTVRTRRPMKPMKLRTYSFFDPDNASFVTRTHSHTHTFIWIADYLLLCICEVRFFVHKLFFVGIKMLRDAIEMPRCLPLAVPQHVRKRIAHCQMPTYAFGEASTRQIAPDAMHVFEEIIWNCTHSPAVPSILWWFSFLVYLQKWNRNFHFFFFTTILVHFFSYSLPMLLAGWSAWTSSSLTLFFIFSSVFALPTGSLISEFSMNSSVQQRKMGMRLYLLWECILLQTAPRSKSLSFALRASDGKWAVRKTEIERC